MIRESETGVGFSRRADALDGAGFVHLPGGAEVCGRPGLQVETGVGFAKCVFDVRNWAPAAMTSVAAASAPLVNAFGFGSFATSDMICTGQRSGTSGWTATLLNS